MRLTDALMPRAQGPILCLNQLREKNRMKVQYLIGLSQGTGANFLNGINRSYLMIF